MFGYRIRALIAMSPFLLVAWWSFWAFLPESVGILSFITLLVGIATGGWWVDMLCRWVKGGQKIDRIRTNKREQLGGAAFGSRRWTIDPHRLSKRRLRNGKNNRRQL